MLCSSTLSPYVYQRARECPQSEHNQELQFTKYVNHNTNLIHTEVGGQMLTTNVLEILDIVLVSRSQQQVALVRQVLQSAAVDELDHVSDCAKVDILNIVSD